MEVVEASLFLGGKPGSPLGIESHTENGFPEAKGPKRFVSLTGHLDFII